MNPAPTQPAILWSSSKMAELIPMQISAMKDYEVLAIGAEQKSAVWACANQSESSYYDDARRMLVEHPQKTLLLCDTSGLRCEDLIQFLKSEGRIIAFAPPVANLEDALDLESTTFSNEKLIMLPQWCFDPLMMEAMDPELRPGRLQGIQISLLNPPSQGGIFPVLYDALSALLHLMDPPIAISGSLSGTDRHIPKDPRALTGHICAHLRFADNSNATITMSDRSHQHERFIRLFCEDGVIHCYPQWMGIYTKDGQQLAFEESSETEIGSHWSQRSILDQMEKYNAGLIRPRPIRHAKIMACIQAFLLSCKTTAPESPRRMLESHGYKLT